MFNLATTRTLSLLMIVGLPVATVLADTNAAMAYVQGSATVNGKTVPQSVAVFPGDNIQTMAGSVVSLTLKGSSIVVPEGSAVTYRENEVALTSGSAQVRTSGGMSARVAAISVAPASAKPAAFEVARKGAEVRITAVSGSLAVSDGKATTLLESGKSLTLRTDGQALPQPAAPKSSISGDTGLIIVVFTAIAAGVGVGIANALADDSPSSP
jgi:ferric-dicitrate binding protein FerR (iron transport regulator)